MVPRPRSAAAARARASGVTWRPRGADHVAAPGRRSGSPARAPVPLTTAAGRTCRPCRLLELI